MKARYWDTLVLELTVSVSLRICYVATLVVVKILGIEIPRRLSPFSVFPGESTPVTSTCPRDLSSEDAGTVFVGAVLDVPSFCMWWCFCAPCIGVDLSQTHG